MALLEKMVAPTTVRNFWKRNDLGMRYKRMLELEEKYSAKGFKPTEEETRQLEKRNPSLPRGTCSRSIPAILLC
jgi:hypothetical protein